VYALLLRVSCRAIRVQFPSGEILVQDLEIRVAFQHTRINRRKHVLLFLRYGVDNDPLALVVEKMLVMGAWEGRSYIAIGLVLWSVRRANFVSIATCDLTSDMSNIKAVTIKEF
jgi:hypothetical protein